MKTYWANFVKAGDPNGGLLQILVDFRTRQVQPPVWLPFNGFQIMQELTPPAVLTPQGPHPFDTFTAEHFCSTWQPLLANEPQQP
jgi:hypothetical protein